MKPSFGLRAHDFGTLPAGELAAKIALSGAACVQLALAKALPGDHLMPDAFGQDGLEAIHHSFKDQGLAIAIIGCYIDTVTPDLVEREFSINRFKAHVDVAATLGCNIIGTETGSPIPYLDQPNGREKAFRIALSTLKQLVDYAEQKGITVGLEPVAEYHALSSAAHAKIMIEEFNSKALGIIFDPVNLVPPLGVPDMDAFLDDCFDAFGDHIVAVHAKDYLMVDNGKGLVKSEALPAGSGMMDWEGVFTRLIKAGKTNLSILLEDTGPDTAVGAFERMQQAWRNAEAKLAD